MSEVEDLPVIGLMGAAGAGKTLVAKVIRDNFGFEIQSFASPLKKLCAEQFGWDLELLDELWYKEEVIPPYGNLTRRQILQMVGTDWFRSVDPDHWVRLAFKGVIEAATPGTRGPYVPKGVVFADVRFPNEVEMIRQDFGGIIARIDRIGGEVQTGASGHESENAVADVRPSMVISAKSGDLRHLKNMAHLLAEMAMRDEVIEPL